MVRTVRYNVPGSTYHLISRFVDRNWFIEVERERAYYLELLGRAVKDSDWRCLAYAVMSNHIHLAVIAGEQPLGRWIRRVNGPFADWMNRVRGRIGPVFVRGPSDREIPPGDVNRLIAYIHNNPVRAGVARVARDSSWTSHAAYMGDVPRPRWLDVEEGFARAGFAEVPDFDQWVNATPSERLRIDLSAVRRTARKRGAIEVGTPTESSDAPVPLMRRMFGHVRHDPRTVIESTAREMSVPLDVLRSRRRNATAVAAKRVAVYCGSELGLTGADLGAAMGLSQQAVSKMRRQRIDAGLLPICERVLERLRQVPEIAKAG